MMEPRLNTMSGAVDVAPTAVAVGRRSWSHRALRDLRPITRRRRRPPHFTRAENHSSLSHLSRCDVVAPASHEDPHLLPFRGTIHRTELNWRLYLAVKRPNSGVYNTE